MSLFANLSHLRNKWTERDADCRILLLNTKKIFIQQADCNERTVGRLTENFPLGMFFLWEASNLYRRKHFNLRYKIVLKLSRNV